MADIPDFMREFDTDTDYGFTPVSQKPAEETSPAIDPKVVENSNLEIAKVKADVTDIKSMMNEVMQIVAEKDSVNKEIQDANVSERFKEIEKFFETMPKLSHTIKVKNPNTKVVSDVVVEGLAGFFA